MWLIAGAMVCLLAAPWVQLSVSAGDGWPHNVLRHHWLMPISCHFRDCKAMLVTSLTHVSGAIASIQTFTFTFTFSSRVNSAVRIWPPFRRFTLSGCSLVITRGQSNLTKSASRGAHSPVRGHPRVSKVVPLNSWGRVSY